MTNSKIQWLFFLTVIIICNSGSKSPTNTHSELMLSGNDSLPSMKPSYQDIYSIDYKWGENIGKLKHDPSTQIENYNYRLTREGLEVRIELYHVNNRIITLEKRTFDKNNVQLTLEAFEFTENNDCMSNTQWSNKEKMSYICNALGVID